jgi:hypothetical protein
MSGVLQFEVVVCVASVMVCSTIRQNGAQVKYVAASRAHAWQGVSFKVSKTCCKLSSSVTGLLQLCSWAADTGCTLCTALGKALGIYR